MLETSKETDTSFEDGDETHAVDDVLKKDDDGDSAKDQKESLGDEKGMITVNELRKS